MNVRLNCPVERVKWEGKTVKIVLKDNEVIECDQVVVAVPIT